MKSTRRNRTALPLVTVLALGTTLALAGCSTSTEPTTAAATEAPAVQGPPERAASGISGEIAYVSDGLLQVQNTESQTAVSYTDDTLISAQVSGSLSDLEVGSCVFVTTDTEDATIATMVTVTAASDSECGIAGGLGGRAPGGTPGNAPGNGAAPDGAPADGAATDGDARTTAPERGAPSGAAAFTAGTVSAVDANGFTVASIGQDDATTSTSLTLTDATSILMTVVSDTSALVLGQCVMVQGEADTSGGYAAASLVVSEPGNDGCSTAAVRRGGQERPATGGNR